jgi:hypothetical protein
MFDPPKWLIETAGVLFAVGLMSWLVTDAADKLGVFD